MPVALLLYFFTEALAFYAVAKLIGVGWALFWLFALMALGTMFAAASLRGTLLKATEGTTTAGRLAGDSALLMTGWALSIIPGFVTSFVGLLLILPPTRALVRRSLTSKLERSVEDFSMRVYNASPMSRTRANYGDFGGFSTSSTDARPEDQEHPVIDADELEAWYRMDSPKRPGEEG